MPSQWPVGRRGAASPRPMWRSFLQPGRITNVRSTISWMTTSGCSRSTSSWSKEYSVVTYASWIAGRLIHSASVHT